MSFKKGIFILFLLSIVKAFDAGNMSNIQVSSSPENSSLHIKATNDQAVCFINETKTSNSEAEFDEDSSEDDLFDYKLNIFPSIIRHISLFKRFTGEFLNISHLGINSLYILFLQFLI